jgi:very-short-patch-repair endonuclease
MDGSAPRRRARRLRDPRHESAFERDRARDRALTAAGWRVARITKRQLDDAPAEIATELRVLLTA